MIFNDMDFEPHFVVENIRRRILPPLATTSIKIPGQDGEKFIKTELSAGIIEVDIRIIRNTKQEVREDIEMLAGKLHTTEPKKLILHDKPGRYNLAILAGETNLDNLHNTAGTTLQFYCYDPVTYGVIKTFDITTKPTRYNLGTYPAKGIITVTMAEATDHLEITLLNTGEFIYLESSFTIGDIVVIDFEKEHIIINDYPITNELYLESDFFAIPVGEFTINVSSGSATLEYKERWL